MNLLELIDGYTEAKVAAGVASAHNAIQAARVCEREAARHRIELERRLRVEHDDPARFYHESSAPIMGEYLITLQPGQKLCVHTNTYRTFPKTDDGDTLSTVRVQHRGHIVWGEGTCGEPDRVIELS